jgi:dolichyl-phosphate-mannose-protein mannosyltransferase
MKNEKWKLKNGKRFWPFLIFLVLAAAFRISVAHWLPNDTPDDGRVYTQIARNVLEQHVYSHDSESPYAPSLIRLPGYPLFLATIYSVFGHGNNGAVRIIQALIDTITCGLVGFLAFLWQPDERKKVRSAFAGLLLAAVCPFTTIYTATILTEALTNFLLMALLIAVTLAFRKLTTDDAAENKKRSLRSALRWWIIAGLIGGVMVMMRPDSGLFLAAVGVTLVATNTWSAATSRRFQSADKSAYSKTIAMRVVIAGAIFSIAFAVVLLPWTIRNWRLFHVFQPLAPAHAEMPGEFVPRGYMQWARTWIDSDYYVAPFVWTLDTEPIDVDDLPSTAFDSAEEKNRVAALLDKYNHPDDYDAADEEPMQTSPNTKPTPSPETEQTDEDSNDDESQEDSEPSSVEMTPEIDAGFAQIARERISHHPFRYYVWLPLKRARTMWFDTHSQYWPFDGTLLPLEDLDYEHHQHIWLPLFAALTAIYTLLGLAGGWVLWRARKFDAGRWLLLVVLLIGFRVALFSSLENPEPRYFVEFFPILSVLGGLAIGKIAGRKRLETGE